MMDGTTARECIFVMGMHRSGTSAFTGLLQLLGVDLGTHLLPPTEENVKGYFENSPIVVLNEGILTQLGSSWDSPFPLPDNWWNEVSFQPYREELRSIIRNEFSQELIAVKDPRLCRIFPFWKLMFSEMGIGYHCIIPLRNPLEVAESLKKRDGSSLEKSLLLWSTYMFETELYSRNCSRVFISFDRLLTETEKTMAHIGEAFGLDFPGLSANLVPITKEFLDPHLKHNNIADMESGDERFAELFQFYRILSGLTSGDSREAEALERIDGLREKFYRSREVFYHDELITERATLESMGKELEEKNQRILEKDALINDKDRLLAVKNRQIAELLNSTSWRFTAPFRYGIRMIKMLYKK